MPNENRHQLNIAWFWYSKHYLSSLCGKVGRRDRVLKALELESSFLAGISAGVIRGCRRLGSPLLEPADLAELTHPCLAWIYHEPILWAAAMAAGFKVVVTRAALTRDQLGAEICYGSPSWRGWPSIRDPRSARRCVLAPRCSSCGQPCDGILPSPPTRPLAEERGYSKGLS
jgi:hypothetical protein